MHLKLSFPNDAEHSDIVCCVAWNNTEEVLSAGQVLIYFSRFFHRYPKDNGLFYISAILY